MRVKLRFPQGVYSQNKKEITKLRKIVSCTEWSGSEWTGKLLKIETDFAKASRGEHDDDVLILDGNAELCKLFIEWNEDWGANIVKDGVSRSKRIHKYGPDTGEFEWKSRGQSEKFREGWIALMMQEHEEKMAA